MKALIYSTFLQWKLDFRNKGILLIYYIIPLIFYVVMGSVFSSINPLSKTTLMQSMTIFAVSMAALLGLPNPLVELFASDVKKTYKVGNIPLWVMLFTNFVSALIHILIVSIIIYISAPIIFKVEHPVHYISYFLLLILFISVSIIIGLIIGILTKKNSTMTMVSQMFFLPTMLLSGIMFPSDMLPSFFGQLSYVLPATHAMKILTSLNEITLTALMPLLAIGVVSILVLILLYKRVLVD